MTSVCSSAAASVAATLVSINASQATLAYVDPGSGSFLLQIVVGAALGAMVAAKMYWARGKEFVAQFFSKRAGDDKTSE